MKDHVKNQLCARIEELEKEKMELNEQMDVAQQERDVSVAHVESLIQEIEGALRIKDLWLPSHYEPEHEGECQALGMMHSAFSRVVVETPETSLARLKAQWQAEALDSLESRIKPLRQTDNGAQGKGYNLALEDCLAAIDMVRRQAEGGA